MTGRSFSHARTLGAWFLSGLLVLLACGPKIDHTACTPGESSACACGQGPFGVQTCLDQGTPGTCDCSGTMTCLPGISISCGCAGGKSGAQVCGADGTFAACDCTPDPRCESGASIPCVCTGGLNGARVCGGDNKYGTCNCQPPAVAMGVLDFPDPSLAVATHVNHGVFWQQDVALSSTLYWDAWVQPRTSGYLVSEGYGGAHALLWGCSEVDGNLAFTGNIWNGTLPVTFGAGEGPAAGEWGHHAVGMGPDPRHGNALTVFTFWNGICVGMGRFGTAPRRSTGQGGGTLFVMGSDHLNMGGRLAALRGWDQSWPNRLPNPGWAFVPDRVFAASPAGAVVDFLAEYTRPAIRIPDLSPFGYSGGLSGSPIKHPGKLANALIVNQMTDDQGFYGTVQPIGPLPTWVEDPDCPYGQTGVGKSVTVPPAPTTSLVSALIFDSFARANQNFVQQRVPSLGKTESGSLGPLTWNTGTVGDPIMAAPFGIIAGRAVFLERQAGLAWVDTGTTEQDVRLERAKLRWEYGTSGIAFRVVNAKTWSYAFVDQELSVNGAPAPLIVGSFVDGVPGPVTTVVPPDDQWFYLRVNAQGSTVTVYVANYSLNTWVKVATLDNRPPPANATGAGLTGATTPDQATSLWRAETFTVCAPDANCL